MIGPGDVRRSRTLAGKVHAAKGPPRELRTHSPRHRSVALKNRGWRAHGSAGSHTSLQTLAPAGTFEFLALSASTLRARAHSSDESPCRH